MQTQIELADLLKEDGIERSLNHANQESPNWSDRALTLLKEFLTYCSTPFMTENFRAYAQKMGLEEPPSKRAFGGVITKAKGLGWIKSVGLGPVSNPTAHRAFASIWEKA